MRGVVHSYKKDRQHYHNFKESGAVTLNKWAYKLVGVSSVKITTTQGRLTLSLAHGGKQREILAAGKIGEADLIYRDGEFYLAISVTIPDVPTKPTNGVIGIDLGVSQVTTDSDGESVAGEPIKAMRRKMRRVRGLLQKKGTKSAKRHLKRVGKKESRYRKNANHVISKQIVAKAVNTAKALALEDLKKIRERSNGFGREMRWLLGGWSFADLRAKITYKAQDAGIPCVFVDPRNTSRTCSKCGHCDKANRKSQSRFECNLCGFVANADVNAAVNIGVRGQLSKTLMMSAA